MEQNNYTILFIDDHSSIYLSSLEPVAKATGFELHVTDNVMDGLDFLNTYPETINAVILDISFPKGEMQGIEAIEKIKQIRAHLPVIMLTDRDSAEDIDKVVECMKKGAYNYVGKRSLNPVYLFQVIDAAIQQAQIQMRLSKKNNAIEKKQRFYTVINACNYGRFKQSGIFGFELVSVNKPGNEIEAARLEKIVMLWHETLLKSISVIYRDEVQFNLKYITDGNKIKCLIIITVYATDEDGLEQIIDNIQHDVNVFFSASKIDSTHPYIFEEISSYDFLQNANQNTSKYKYNVFYRKPIKIKPTQGMGFNTSVKTESQKTGEYNPDELIPFPAKSYFDNELLRALLNQNEYAEIDVQLMPKQLCKQEIDLIRQAIKNTSTLDTKNFTQEELKYFADYLQKFIATTNDKFLISVILKRNSQNWEQHLKTGIFNYFFGSQTEIGYQSRKSDNLFRFCTSDKGILNQLPFFYSINDAIQAFRLPVPGLNDLPGIQQQSHSFHLLPSNLPQEGVLLGVKKAGQINNEIKLGKDALARHLYIMGQTGTGKSTLLKTMIGDCLKQNKGFTIIDPHGDLFDEVLKMIPKSKKEKVLIINTADAENSATLNPLHYNENLPQAKSLIINEIIRVFSSLYDMKTSGGPVFETYFKNGLLLVMDEKVQEKFGKGTLADMSKIFFSDIYRKQLLAVCGNQSVTDFFKAAESMSGEQVFANFAIYITSKLTRFVEDFYLAPILSGKKKNIDFKKLMDDENILLVKMDKGLIGTDNTSLLGQILLSNLFMAGMSRTDIKIEQRKPHYIFIDEFQNFVKGDAGNALSEVRKYGLNLILANQTLGQLDDYLLQSLLGNVGSIVFFRPGINDYEKIRHYLEPDFKREDVLKLPNFNCIARLMIDNVPSAPFVFQTKIS